MPLLGTWCCRFNPTGARDPQATAAVLGYLQLLLELIAHYTGGPLLHEALFSCSTTHLWQPASFSQRWAQKQAAVVNLYPPSVATEKLPDLSNAAKQQSDPAGSSG